MESVPDGFTPVEYPLAGRLHRRRTGQTIFVDRTFWHRSQLAARIEVVSPDDAGPFTIEADRSAPSATGRRRIRLSVTYRGDAEAQASIRFGLALPPGDRPWWLVPGAFYGENRPAASRKIFPRYAPGPPDPAGMVSDHWEFRADRAATP